LILFVEIFTKGFLPPVRVEAPDLRPITSLPSAPPRQQPAHQPVQQPSTSRVAASKPTIFSKPTQVSKPQASAIDSLIRNMPSVPTHIPGEGEKRKTRSSSKREKIALRDDE